MPPKRKNDDTGEPSARERKKLKMADARTISVQETSARSGSTLANNQGNAVASSSATGPSKTVIQFDCAYSRALFCRGAMSTVCLAMQGLPASIDVERFTEARAYEIDAMQKAIKTAGHVTILLEARRIVHGKPCLDTFVVGRPVTMFGASPYACETRREQRWTPINVDFSVDLNEGKRTKSLVPMLS
ncbi:hypothetical protein J3R83DRAFT_13362 [Lanmaoa asiatica]|nr:hypothetical protein J3R83DRAFT_13362 [Lanmaoa asiatica]